MFGNSSIEFSTINNFRRSNTVGGICVSTLLDIFVIVEKKERKNIRYRDKTID